MLFAHKDTSVFPALPFLISVCHFIASCGIQLSCRTSLLMKMCINFTHGTKWKICCCYCQFLDPSISFRALLEHQVIYVGKTDLLKVDLSQELENNGLKSQFKSSVILFSSSRKLLIIKIFAIFLNSWMCFGLLTCFMSMVIYLSTSPEMILKLIFVLLQICSQNRYVWELCS